MLLKTTRACDVRESQVTDESLYISRRKFMQGTAALAGASMLPASSLWPQPARAAISIGDIEKSAFSTTEELNSFEDITSYNNFYELGLKKGDPKRNADHLITEPWSIRVEGECDKPGDYDLEDFIPAPRLEERIYRLRCVEAWSMVIPWVGVELGPVLKRFEPTSRAKYVQFFTLYDPKNLPGQRRSVLDWPYREGLRMDEAMHPLTILAVGLYGKELPNQNGAPLRLVVPWKYGFKSIKSIVRIRFSQSEPATSWNQSAPREYGFYSNVNPAVNHPRWSQKRERRIGEILKRKTLPFNGYAEQVADLYAGMDLKKHF